MAVRLVVFDLGGVMIRIRHAWGEILGELGLSLPDGFSQDRLAEHGLLASFQNGEMDERSFLVALALEFDLRIEDVERAHGLILREEYDGALELVKEIQAAGLKVVCLSNTNSLHYREFFSGRYPVCEAFDELLASQKLGLSKPDPRIYEFVGERFGVAAEEIVFFDDSLVNVDAGRARGWIAIEVDPTGDPPGAMRAALRGLGVLPPV